MRDSVIVRGLYGDIDEYISKVPNWDLRIAQLSAGANESGHLLLSANNFEYLFFQHSLKSLHQAVQPKPGISLFVPLSLAPVVHLSRSSNAMAIACAPCGHAINVITPDCFYGATIYISYKKLHELLGQVYDFPAGFTPCKVTTYFHPTSEQYNRISAMLFAIKNQFQSNYGSDSARKEWLSHYTITQVIPLLIQIMGYSTNLPVVARLDKFQSALDIIFNNLDSPPTILELATRLNMTKRNLQYIFKDRVGITPKQFINTMRLNVARKRLWHSVIARGQISNIANELDYWHMGKFSQDFKLLFGKSPGEVLKTQNDSIQMSV